MASRILGTIRAFARDERGQDLVEYALLSGFIGVAGVVTMNQLGITMGTVYAGWTAAVNALWESPPH